MMKTLFIILTVASVAWALHSVSTEFDERWITAFFKGVYPIPFVKQKAMSVANIIEKLWNIDSNGTSYSTMQLDLQGNTTATSKRDEAPLKLFKYVNETFLFAQPTVIAFRKLLDNYNPETTKQEYETVQERKEIDKFLDAVCDTNIMEETRKFFEENGKPYSTMTSLKALLKEAWFTLYPRSRNWTNSIDSSGFEHVFLGEAKKRSKEVSGLHNWIRAYLMEKAGELNYTGYVNSYTELLPGRFVFGARLQAYNNYWKSPFSSFVFGSSLEFDLAAHTICFVMQPNKSCNFKIKNHNLRLRNMRYPKFNYIDTAYPEV